MTLYSVYYVFSCYALGNGSNDSFRLFFISTQGLAVIMRYLLIEDFLVLK